MWVFAIEKVRNFVVPLLADGLSKLLVVLGQLHALKNPSRALSLSLTHVARIP
jgi:hypothetical protein